MTQTPPQKNDDSASEELLEGLTELFNASLGFGAALARAAARLTGGAPPPPKNDGPFDALMHYSITTVGNVLRVAGSATGGVTTGRPAPAAPGQAAAQGQATPTVTAGATLRMPLSIENPGVEPMIELRFGCLEMAGGTAGLGEPLDVGVVRFEPDVLTIAPRDFEKLTVFIDIPATTAPGGYRATIGLPDGGFQVQIPFEVKPPPAAGHTDDPAA